MAGWPVNWTHSAPDLLLNLFAECECIAELCVLQRVLVSLGEVRRYMVRAKLGVCSEKYQLYPSVYTSSATDSNCQLSHSYCLILILENCKISAPAFNRLLCVTCSASSLLMAKASWSCRSSSPELCGQACSGSAPPEWEPTDRLPPRLGAEGAEEAGAETNKHVHG